MSEVQGRYIRGTKALPWRTPAVILLKEEVELPTDFSLKFPLLCVESLFYIKEDCGTESFVFAENEEEMVMMMTTSLLSSPVTFVHDLCRIICMKNRKSTQNYHAAYEGVMLHSLVHGLFRFRYAQW